MSESNLNKYRLIAVPSNQGLCNHYESGIKSYAQDKENRLWKDTFYPAWHNDRIGGERAAMIERLNVQKLFTKNDFEQFKAARLAEMDEILKTANPDVQRAIFYEKYILNKSHSYLEFGKNMKLTDPYARSFILHNPEGNGDKEQVLYNCSYIESTVNGRYEMMQSIAFQIANGSKLPEIEPQAQVYRKRIIDGVEVYRKEAEKYTHFWQFERTDNIERDKVAFLNIRTPAFQAKGRTQTLNDAILAITSSSEWPLICQYYQNKYKFNNTDAYGAWNEGSISSLKPLAGRNRIDINGAISTGLARDDLKQIAQPALQNLNEAELMYRFLSQHVNEYLDYKKEHAQEIESLNAVHQERFVLDTAEYGNMLSQTCKTLNSLCNRMVSDHEAIATVCEIGREVGIVSACAIPGVGLPLSLSLAGASALTIETQREWIKDWADCCNFQWMTDIKNAPVLEDAQKIISQAQEQVRRNNNSMNRYSDEEFKKAVEWGIENGDVNTKNLLEPVLEALKWKEMPEAEKEKELAVLDTEEAGYAKIAEKLNEFNSAVVDCENALKLDPNNQEIINKLAEVKKEYNDYMNENQYDVEAYKEFMRLKTEMLTAKASAETGFYFANSYAKNEYFSALNGDGRVQKIRLQLTDHFNEHEQKMMADVEKYLTLQGASNFEAKMRGDLIMKWRNVRNNVQITSNNQEEKPAEQTQTPSSLNDTLKNASENTVNSENVNDYGIDPRYDIYDDIYMY